MHRRPDWMVARLFGFFAGARQFQWLSPSTVRHSTTLTDQPWVGRFGARSRRNGPLQVIGRIPAFRIPGDPSLWQQTLSPDGKWQAAPLVDRGTTNLWMMPSDGGALRQLTDFGERSILIMRHVSWSPDSKYLFAAVDESGADIVLLDGLLP